MDSKYRAQVDLLLQAIPFVAKEKQFALKGGTAINLFIRDMPRMSVDIDLTYLLVNNRETALKNISNGLERIKSDLEKSIKGISVTSSTREGHDAKINCQKPDAQIKIEVNTTTRGHIKPTRLLQISDSVQKEFGKFAAMQVVSQAELFGGKICAALDRQHPRDLFDVKLLFENEGFTDDIKDGFLVSLISHDRLIHEVIRPNLYDQRSVYETQFKGMARIPFSYEDYEITRERLIKELHQKLTDQDRQFLICLKKGFPNWKIFPLEGIEELPAVKWKLNNIRTLIKNNPDKQMKSRSLEAYTFKKQS